MSGIDIALMVREAAQGIEGATFKIGCDDLSFVVGTLPIHNVIRGDSE